MPTTPTARDRRDRCPGVLRPWRADDGLLVRLRLVGGRLPADALLALLALAEAYGDGQVHLTSRANLQLRGLPSAGDALAPEVVAAIEATGLLPSRAHELVPNLQLRGLPHDEDGQLPAYVVAAVERTGLLPSRSHELVRNRMVSPQTGLAGGSVDLREAAAALDHALLSDPRLAALPGRFLFVLDDGRGDLVERPCDLGLVAVDDRSAQLRVGDGWGPVVALEEAVGLLSGLALAFLSARGEGASAPWHVGELAAPLAPPAAPDPRLPRPAPPLPFGDVAGGRHVEAPGGELEPDLVRELVAAAPELVVTPWRGVLVPTTPEDA